MTNPLTTSIVALTVACLSLAIGGYTIVVNRRVLRDARRRSRAERDALERWAQAKGGPPG